ncbi:uncharacterized protein LOC129588818 [Paramacrobiotus metropolitanus]|uniref:uncharacterized protein LOC129588818 n=1 Tax=Paramacrobiotus metropolitanus TaxID=2943436 RepID=UPI0024465D7E|nr:uncharacterized protein LOC129588818 [Paramacrobiotus metropolitanus]
MPLVLEAVLQMCLESFNLSERINISVRCQTLDNPIYLSMRKLSDFNIADLVAAFTKANLGRTVLDDTFTIRIFRTVMPSGGSWKRKHRHIARDAKRFCKSIVTVRADDNLCLPAALYLGKYRLTHDVQDQYKNQWKHLYSKDGVTKLTAHAKEIVQLCDLPTGRPCDLDDLAAIQEECFPDYQIKVISADHGNVVIARIPEKKEPQMQEIYVLLEDNHFDLVPTVNGIFNSSYYCGDCDLPYSNKERHLCGAKCRYCYRPTGDCVPGTRIQCEHCRRCFNNQACFDIHKTTRRNGKTFCEQLFYCVNCKQFVSLLFRKDAKHQCGEMYCTLCQEWVQQATHKCFLKTFPKPLPPSPDRPKPETHYIFFDYETFNDPVNGHTPACVVAQYEDGTEFRFPADGQPMTLDVGRQFGEWLFLEQHRNHTIIAHNFRGYDGHFVLKHLLDNKLRGVEVIKRGNQLLQLRYRSLNITARDTLSFLPMRLSSLPKAVGLDVAVKKGDFPHNLNHPDNWDKILPWPEPEMYMFDGMKQKEKQEFLKWHAEAKEAANGCFDFRAEIMSYCSNDVTVLRLCALKFVQDFTALTCLNPLDSITMSSACNRYYRTYHLEPEKIAALSAHGPHRNRRTSIQATQWLEVLNRAANGHIQHGRNGKEVKIGPYFVDGLDATTRTVYEYNGCVFHGHPECTEPEDRSPFSRKLMREVHEEYVDRVRYPEDENYTVTTMWECQWLKERQETEIAAFLSTQNLREPLNPREAFKGGRTNASRLFYEIQPGEKILHYDVVSLYPFVNKTKPYPIGHPEIILSDFKDVREYNGLLYCKVLPPSKCRYPVLPLTINKNLVFALCRTCAETQSKEFCRHSDAERCLDGVWTTPELHHALDRGYAVQTVHEVWHWEKMEAGVYAAYMNKFLKVKLEASGWPSWCKTQRQKDDFIRRVKEREGIDLDPEAMLYDAGRRNVAKNCLNCLWGKQGQQDDMSRTKLIYKVKDYVDLIRSKAVEILDVFAIKDACRMVTYRQSDDYNEGSNATNVAVAAFTTAHARLVLLALMEKLDDRLMYYDTDSVVFLHHPGDWLPETGSILGDWDDQLQAGESHIVKIVSCGPKVYSYETDTGHIELKAKGIEQSGYTEGILDFDEITQSFTRTGKALDFNALQRLLDGTDSHVQVIYPQFIKRNGKTQEINTVQLFKKLQMVYDKRMLFPDFSTLPFGTKQ